MRMPRFIKKRVWRPGLGYYYLLILLGHEWYEFKRRTAIKWRQLTYNKRQRELQIIAGIRDSKGRLK